VPKGATVPATMPGITGQFGVAMRTGGTQQLTFDGAPLYTFVKDKKPGDVTGHGLYALGGYWWAVVAGAAGGYTPAPTAPRWLVVDTKTHTATLTLIASYNGALGGFNFNGDGKGKMVVSVPVGYTVHVNFTNEGSIPHSAVITPYSERNSTSGFPLAFHGASTKNPTAGTAQGKTERFSFVANKAGKYALVCVVPGHAVAGMWDVFEVTHGGKATIKV
jgi:sulfocyanin